MAFLHLFFIAKYHFVTMKKIKYRLVFNRKGKLTQEGKALIQVEAYLERRRCYFTTHIYVRLAGLRKHFSFHSARHTNATLLLGKG